MEKATAFSEWGEGNLSSIWSIHHAYGIERLIGRTVGFSMVHKASIHTAYGEGGLCVRTDVIFLFDDHSFNS